MDWEAAVRSDRGLRRLRNEDAALALPERQLYAVADGMGGHVAGDLASRTAIAALDAAFQNGRSAADVAGVGDQLRAAIALANRAVLDAAEAEPEVHGMGTTLTALWLPREASTCVVGHVGDSRAYRLRDERLEQLTTDHTWVQERVNEGLLTPDQARDHPYASVLTRVLGLPDLEAADIVLADARSGDRFLLCSDGLSTMIDDDGIRSILTRAAGPDDAADQLVAAANDKGGFDNITVIVLHAV